MKKSSTLLATLIALIAWTTMGGLIGFATGYIVYVKQTAVFQSTGTLSISSPPAKEASLRDDDGSAGDLSPIIAGQEVLRKAVNDGELGRLFGISGKDTNEIAQSIQSSGDLKVVRGPSSDIGTTYELSLNGLTPSTSQIALHAICESATELLTEGGQADQWQQAVDLLTTVRREVEDRIANLEQQRAVIAPQVTSVKREGVSISGLSVQFTNLQQEVDHLESLRSGVVEKLRRIETLIEEGASTETILVSLNVPVKKAPPKAAPQTVPTKVSGETAADRQIEMAKRMQAEQAIKIKMKPLLLELDKLRERYGEKHPKVVFKKSEIEVYQLQLDALTPINDIEPVESTESRRTDALVDDKKEDELPAADNGTEQNGTSASSQTPTESKNEANVKLALSALRLENKQINDEVEKQNSALQALASKISQEELKAREYERLTDSLVVQHQLLQQAVSRLSKLPQQSPFSGRIVTVVNQPASGVQVSPELRPLMRTSVGAGILAGLGLFVLVLLASIMTSEQETQSA